MIRWHVTVLTLLVVACGPIASTPSTSPAATSGATVLPTPTATPTPAPTAQPTAAPGTPIPLPTVAQLSAPSADVVWAQVASTHLFRSSDRGATWTERSLPSPLLNVDISFISDREGWILSAGAAATQCMSQGFAIWQTTDAAQTWQRVYESPDPSRDALCKDAIAFADATHGWLTMSSPNSSAVIARTSDGGRTWTRSQPLPDPPGFTSGAAGHVLRAGPVKTFAIQDPLNVGFGTLFISALGQGSGNGTEYAFRSTDGGVTWRYASTAPIDQMDVVFLTPSHWAQIFLRSQSAETTDAGVTWHSFVTDYQQAAPIAPQIVFGDANVGYATVRGGIQRTLDGGAHWGPIKTPGT